MSTFLYEFITDLENSWHEVELLIEKAKEIRDTEEDLYDALCRAISILIISQLEAFTKLLLKSVIHDLNRFSNFKDLPKSIQRTFVKKYIVYGNVVEKGIEKKVDLLIEKFSEIGCDIEYEPFYISKNKNPTPHLIQTVFNNLGINNIFHNLNGSKFEDIFSLEITAMKEELKNYRNYSLGVVCSFPYAVNPNNYNIGKNKTNNNTIWQDFLEDVNNKRHAIVHGNIRKNNDDIDNIEKSKIKLEIFQYATIIVLSEKLQKIKSQISVKV